MPASCKWTQHSGLPHIHFLEQRGLPSLIWKRRCRAFIWNKFLKYFLLKKAFFRPCRSLKVRPLVYSDIEEWMSGVVWVAVSVYDFTAFSTSLGTFIACHRGVHVINILCLYCFWDPAVRLITLYCVNILCLYWIQDAAVSVYNGGTEFMPLLVQKVVKCWGR